MSDQETLGGFENPRGKAVGTSIVSFVDDDTNMELIGFDYFDIEESTITWHWESKVTARMVTLPVFRIREVTTTFDAVGE